MKLDESSERNHDYLARRPKTVLLLQVVHSCDSDIEEPSKFFDLRNSASTVYSGEFQSV